MKLLITGHSEFSIGMQSALAMIAGELEDVIIIPFLAEETVDEYRQKVAAEIQMFDQAICFTDLLGGTHLKPVLNSLRKKIKFCCEWHKLRNAIRRLDDAK